GDGADAAQHRRSALAARELDHEPVEGGNGDVADAGDDLVEHLHALLNGEKRILDRIDEDGDGEVVEDLRAALNEIDVAVGGRVEGAGIEGFGGHWSGSDGILRHRRACQSHAVDFTLPGLPARRPLVTSTMWLHIVCQLSLCS